MHNDDTLEITKRLDVIISLLARFQPGPENRLSLREQIRLLDSAGLGPTEIGRILGRPGKSVSSELAKMKSKGGKQ